MFKTKPSGKQNLDRRGFLGLLGGGAAAALFTLGEASRATASEISGNVVPTNKSVEEIIFPSLTQNSGAGPLYPTCSDFLCTTIVVMPYSVGCIPDHGDCCYDGQLCVYNPHSQCLSYQCCDTDGWNRLCHDVCVATYYNC